MNTPELAGAEFGGLSWAAWRCIARLIDGDAHLLGDADRELALRLTGRTALPTAAPDELAVGAGRRSGKSRFCALAAAWYAAQDYSARLAPGETAVIALAAPDRKQAALLLDYTRAILMGSAILRAEIANETADSIELSHGTRIEVVTSNYRSIRGRTICASILDECSFLRSEDSALPDIELYRALLPSMLTLRGTLIAISSPHMRRGLMYELYGRYFSKDNVRGLFIQADSLTLNPTLDSVAIDRAVAADPEAGQSEYMGLFRTDLSSYLSVEDLDRSIVPNRRSLPMSFGHRYKAFCDPSGGRSDSMTLGISHWEGNRVILDRLVAVAPPFDPEATVVRFCEVLSSFGLSRVTGDAYGGDWIVSSFARHGVSYQSSERTASEIYVEAGPLFSQGLVELLDIPSLRVELSLLERRPRPGGRGDVVDHPRNSHDDQAVAALGSLLLAAADMNVGADTYSNNVSKARCDYDPLADPAPVRTVQPRHVHLLPDNLRLNYEPDFRQAAREHDPLSR
jgi:Terminase large subunit, T4likevirus-type, N-terminal